MIDNQDEKMRELLQKVSQMAKSGKQKDLLSEFIVSIIDEKGLNFLNDEVKDVFKKDLMKRLNTFIAAKVIAALSDIDVLTFDEMIQTKKPEKEVQEFVATHVPDFVSFLTDALLEFRGVYLGLIEAPKDFPVDLPPAPPAVIDKRMN